jgi:hypothetical protein
MIGLGFYNVTQTTTDLNGPFLRFTTEPEAETVDDGGSVTLTGIATAEFKHNPTIPGERVTNTGEIEYQWYIDGTAAVDTTDKISGSQTNELTLSNLSNPTETGRSIVLRATYAGSAYQSEEGAITAGIAASTGNGVNQPIDTTAVVVTVNPTISIDTQPEEATAAQGVDATFTVVASASDGSDVNYQWNQDGNPLSDSDTVSGANSPTLTISSTTVGTSTITVTVSHPTAGNSPVTSDGVDYQVVSARTIIEYYLHADAEGGSFFGSGSQNLFDGDLTLTADPNRSTQTVSFHSPEQDITVKATLAAAAGAGRNGNSGGQGGKSSFIITLERNQEYILKLGSQVMPTGGANGGGGAAYIYKKGRLLLALGGGGGAGSNGRGGFGGGAGVAGERGGGSNGGSGGSVFSEGTLPTIGVFPGGDVYGGVNWTARDGGRISGCTPGNSYFTSRFSPCEDMGQQRFRTSNGSEISQTPVIERGYKPGIGHRNNGGNGSGNEGGGGSGATGGNAANGSGSGGGGASGYTSGDVTILTTQLGGNSNTNAFVTFEYYIPD